MSQPAVASAVRTILIVDDESGVIDAIRETLAPLGCAIAATTDPQRALRLLETGNSIDLLITDLLMPNMDGATLLKLGRQIRPDLKAVLTTGLASDGEIRRWRRRGEVVVVKPWLDGELSRAVEAALGR